MSRVICLGEILIDFVSTKEGLSVGEAPAFEKKPGGAPANVAVGLARLGVASSFVGKVGDDAFGVFLRDTLHENGVDTTGMTLDEEANTTLAFVSLAAGGERSFVFYRNPGADTLLSPSEIPIRLFDSSAGIFHFGSLSLTHEPARSATIFALEMARKKEMLISYDPNLREALWPDLDTARERIMSVVGLAHVLKVSDEEAVFLTGKADPFEGAAELANLGPMLVLLTLGAGGCAFFRAGGASVAVPGYTVISVDTTGAGDAFVAAVLAQCVDRTATPRKLASLSDDELRDIGSFANAAGALATTKRGAIPAMPTRNEVLDMQTAISES